MTLSNRTKIIILILLVCVAIYMLSRSNTSTKSESMFVQDIEKMAPLRENDGESVNSIPKDLDLNESNEQTVPTSTSKLINRMLSKNSTRGGKDKIINYADGDRSQQSSELDSYYEPQSRNSNEIVALENTGTTSGFAPYVPNKNGNKKLTDQEKYDTSSLLPKEKHSDWFDNPYETTNIEETHLINIHRPIGVNTIQSSMRNASHDLRPSPPNPKMQVSPWNNSTIEPDLNRKGDTLCI